MRNTLAKGGDKALLLAELGSLQFRSGKTEKALGTLTESNKLNRDNMNVLGHLNPAHRLIKLARKMRPLLPAP